MTRWEFKALSEEAAGLAEDWLGEDREARLAAVRTLAHARPQLLAVTIRRVQIRSGRKANEAVRNLCDAIGNV